MKTPNRSTNYRRRLKDEHPEKYKEYLAKQKERCKRNRENLKKELSEKTPSKSCVEKGKGY